MTKLRFLTIPRWRRLAIFCSGVIVFIFVGRQDGLWAKSLFDQPWPYFTDVMSRSFYEGDLPGTSDLGVTLPIAAFFLWLYQKYGRQPRQWVEPQKLQFIFLSGLFASLVTIHSLKWLISRARPKVFFQEVLPTLNTDLSTQVLPGFMGWTGPRGYSWNSFPSGHTSTCALLLTLVYLSSRSHKQQIALFGGIFLLCATMAAARAMAGMHWISDSVASFFLVWMVVDIVHQKTLRKPNIQ